MSYCRTVPAARFSNEKKKGTSNRKNGSKYLSWAYAEAAELARRFDPDARAYYDRKRRHTNEPIAYTALANKLSRAAYYIMRDGVLFAPVKMFSCGKGATVSPCTDWRSTIIKIGTLSHSSNIGVIGIFAARAGSPMGLVY